MSRPGCFPNYAFNGNTSTKADQVGVRIDHEFNQNNTVFFRFNRSNNNVTSPEGFPGLCGEQIELFAGICRRIYAHLQPKYDSESALWIHPDLLQPSSTSPPATDFLNALNFTETAPVKNDLPLGPGVGVANGYTGVEPVCGSRRTTTEQRLSRGSFQDRRETTPSASVACITTSIALMMDGSTP